MRFFSFLPPFLETTLRNLYGANFLAEAVKLDNGLAIHLNDELHSFPHFFVCHDSTFQA